MVAFRNNKSLEPSEMQIQIGVVSWAKLHENQYPALKNLMHVPNQGKRSWRFGKELKEMGLSPGAPDLLLLWPGTYNYQGEIVKYGGLAIECKSAKGKLTEQQEDWRSRLSMARYEYLVVRSVDDGIFALKQYLGVK
jgi:hypothetical protein